MEGEQIVTRGDEEFRIGPGDAIFLPREVPHAQRRVVPGERRQVVICIPGVFEQFFRELAQADRDGKLGAGPDRSLSLLETTEICRELTGNEVSIERVAEARQAESRLAEVLGIPLPARLR